MREILIQNKGITAIYLIFLAVMCGLLMAVPKNDLHIFINQQHKPAADFVFRWITHLGDGLFVVALMLAMLPFGWRKAILTGAGSLLAGLFTQILKRGVFGDVPRPSRYFKDIYDLQFVEGVTMHGSYSFPSGHATTAFAVFVILALLSNNKYYKTLFLILAVLASFSRVYLAQHFVADITVGSMVGVTFALSTYLIGKRIGWIGK